MIDLPPLTGKSQLGKYNPFGLGFRPFFLLTALWGMIAILLWGIMLLSNNISVPHYADALIWHKHEMLIGMGSALAAGFLLTAVRNWTKLSTPTGIHLALLAATWVAGRLVWTFGGDSLPAWLIMLIDFAFLPWLTYAIGRPIWQRKQWNQLVFPAVLLALMLANTLIDIALWQEVDLLVIASKLASYALLALLVVMGGRIIPFFTEKGCHLRFKPTPKILVKGYLGFFGLVALLDISDTFAPIMAVSAVIAAVLFWTQLYYWQSWRTGSNPLVWILHLGYAGIGLGFMLKAASVIWLELAPLATHAWMMITMGGIGLGMMARVSLGHSGRTLTTLPLMRSVFVLMIAAGITRLFVPLHPMALPLSFLLWCLALGLFFWRYLPVWLETRLDGRPD
jgi:uncharacterized protein involved in response to NO